MRPETLGALAGAMLLALSGAPPSSRSAGRDRSAAELMDVVMWNRESIGGPFALTDQNGARRTDADFRGKLILVYFGFTYCPDICPTDLQNIGLALIGSARPAKPCSRSLSRSIRSATRPSIWPTMSSYSTRA